MDRLDGMIAFVAVAEAGSFTTAAEKLGLSRALVSKRVAALEMALGARLLNRTTRQVSLTGAGSEFLERCRGIVGAFEEAATAVQRQRLDPAGSLRVNAPMSFGILHLAPALVDFMRSYPRLQVQLALTDRFVDLIDEGFDVAVRIGRLKDSSLVVRRLAPARRILCASPAYLAGRPPIAHPCDLLQHRCLHYGYLASGTTWQLRGPEGDHRVAIVPAFCANNGEVLMQAAIEGLGIVLLPTFLCGEAVGAGRLARVLPAYQPPEIAINAIWPSNRMLPAKVRAFVDFLVERFAGVPSWDLPQGTPLADLGSDRSIPAGAAVGAADKVGGGRWTGRECKT